MEDEGQTIGQQIGREEDDVEGHQYKGAAKPAAKPHSDEDDDDVEGHQFTPQAKPQAKP